MWELTFLPQIGHCYTPCFRLLPLIWAQLPPRRHYSTVLNRSWLLSFAPRIFDFAKAEETKISEKKSNWCSHERVPHSSCRNRFQGEKIILRKKKTGNIFCSKKEVSWFSLVSKTFFLLVWKISGTVDVTKKGWLMMYSYRLPKWTRMTEINPWFSLCSLPQPNEECTSSNQSLLFKFLICWAGE